jgi:SNF2 family DNA or RNA helicase
LKLTLKDIQKKILLFFYNQGLELFEKGVVKAKVVEKSENFVRINSTVKDEKEYIQDIEIKEDETLKIDGKCNCEIGYNCKHVAASLIYYLKNLQNREYSYVDFWINSFKKVELKEEFLIYRLIQGGIWLYQVKRLKSNLPSKGKPAKLMAHPAFLNDEKDQEILPILNALDKFNNSSSVYDLRGKLGNFAIKTIVDFQKLYIEDNKYPTTIIKGNNLRLKFEKQDDNYLLKPQGNLIFSNPPFLIDKKNNQLVELEIDGNILSRISLLKEIKFEDITKVANFILKNMDVELEVPQDIKTKVIEISPLPRIVLFNDSFKLDFKYDDYFVPFYPRKEKKEFFSESERIEIIRNRQKEENYKKLLEDRFGFEFTKFNNNIFVMLEKNSKKLELFNQFLNSLDKLQNDGWIIEKSEDFELIFDSDSKIVLESDENDGWFNLSFEFEFNGKKAPLAPLVSSIINEFEDLDLMPEKVYLEVNKNYFVEVESETLKPVIKTILALFDKKDKEKLKVTLADAALLEIEDLEIKGSKKLFEIAKKLKNFEGIKEVTLPKGLNAKLRDYQKDGLNWLNFLWEYSFGGILADDMGLGKTIQTLSHLLRLKEANKLQTSLIVVPTSLLANWKNEIKEFTPALSKVLLYGNDREYIFNKMDKFDIIITTYAVLTRDIDKLKEFEFDYIILDEAQKIKNPRAKVSMAVKLLKSKHKLALSGTPIENHLGEIWSIFSFVMPGFLGNYKFFKEYFQNPIEKEKDFARQHLLHRKLKPFILRRTKENVVKELPPKTEIIKYTQFGEKQAKLYETIRITMEEKVKEAIANKGLNASHLTILDALLKLRQVCCDPRLLKLNKDIHESAKLDLFLEIIDELLEEDRKILVFSQFTSMLAIIEKELQIREIEYVKLTGATKNREKVINEFKNSGVKIFLISLKAGGVGLNLTEADTIIHYDPWWNPAVENQATDRAYRIGQDKPVFVYKLIVENTIEQKIIELQKKKANIQNSVYDENDVNFDKNELLDLLK